MTFVRTSSVALQSLKGLRAYAQRRCIHGTGVRLAITNFQMPAMSPTMTEGGVASWKKKEGEAFAAGDVLLEIETDKATIDVEAQDDGIMGKILAPDGTKNVPVGKIIALLAEEGDDISNLEVPKEEPASTLKQEAFPPPPLSQTPPTTLTPREEPTASPTSIVHPKHSRPLLPSVYRLLVENSIADGELIKGTGIRGMLLKGDVLAYLGKASNPRGTDIQAERKEPTAAAPKKEAAPVLDGAAIRRLIVSNMLQTSIRARNSMPVPKEHPTFDSVVADYLPKTDLPPAVAVCPLPKPTNGSADYLDGLI